MFRIALSSFLIVTLAAWSAAAQPRGDEGLLGGPPPSAYAHSRAVGPADGRGYRGEIGGYGQGDARGGVVIDSAPLPFDPQPLPPNTAPGDCVVRGGQGWARCDVAGRYDGYGRPQARAYESSSSGGRYGYLRSETTTDDYSSSYSDTGYGPPRGYGAGYAPPAYGAGGYGYGYSSDYPSGVGYAYGYGPEGGYAPGYESPYGYGQGYWGYRTAGKDAQGYLVWPGKVPRRR